MSLVCPLLSSRLSTLQMSGGDWSILRTCSRREEPQRSTSHAACTWAAWVLQAGAEMVEGTGQVGAIITIPSGSFRERPVFGGRGTIQRRGSGAWEGGVGQRNWQFSRVTRVLPGEGGAGKGWGEHQAMEQNVCKVQRTEASQCVGQL